MQSAKCKEQLRSREFNCPNYRRWLKNELKKMIFFGAICFWSLIPLCAVALVRKSFFTLVRRASFGRCQTAVKNRFANVGAAASIGARIRVSYVDFRVGTRILTIGRSRIRQPFGVSSIFILRSIPNHQLFQARTRGCILDHSRNNRFRARRFQV